jgi:anthranilate phosphoribosyltransferase
LAGGNPQENAEIIREVLDGEPGPRRDVVLINAAAALFVAQKADDVKAALELAQESIDSGAAKRKLEELSEFTARAGRT